MEMHNGCLRKTGAGCAVSSKDWNNLQVSFPMIGIITVGNIIRSFRPSAVMQGLLPFIVVFVLWMPTRAAGPAQAGGSDIGQELQNTEKLILKSSKPSKKRVKPEVLIQDLKGSKEEKTGPVAAQSKVGYKINKLLVRGDQDILEQTKLFDELNKEVVGQMFTAKDIQALVRKYNKLLVDKGYYLAGISTPPTDYSKGVLILEVDKGRVGKMSFYKMPRTDQSATMSTREPYRGTFYSESQLRLRLSDLKEGKVFDYNEFYRDVYTINSHPDLTMNTDLRVRKVEESYPPQRYVDMDFMVKERVPLHGVLSYGNSGTKATGDWRPSLTLQDLNLTKHDDVFSINLGPISTNLKDMKSFGGSYYLPYNYANGGGFTFYGGYSDLDAENVVEGINVRGNGYFAGLMGSYRLINSEEHLLSLSLGFVYRSVSDQLVLAGENGDQDFALEQRTVVLVPWSLALSYSSGKPDAWGGRTFFTSQTSLNVAGFPGVSDDEQVESLRANAKATYYIERIQMARLQPLFGGSSDVRKIDREPWTLFLKLDSQLASGPLVPAEQKAIGGMDAVRGYPERVVQGDDGINGSVELRTPLAEDWLSSPFRSGKEREEAKRKGQSLDRLQLVLFADGGYVRSRDSLSEKDSYSLFSIGTGLRLSVTSYFQARFDWGVPFGYDKSLEAGADPVTNYGRFHLSAQLQF